MPAHHGSPEALRNMVFPGGALEITVHLEMETVPLIVAHPLRHRTGEAGMGDGHLHFATGTEHAMGFCHSAGIILDVHQAHGGYSGVECRVGKAVEMTGVGAEEINVQASSGAALARDLDQAFTAIDAGDDGTAMSQFTGIAALAAAKIEDMPVPDVAEHLQRQGHEEMQAIVVLVGVRDPLVSDAVPRGGRGIRMHSGIIPYAHTSRRRFVA